MEIPDKIFFKIGEVSDVAGVKPYVLRYWETEFSIVPHKSSSGQRLYRRKDIERILLIKRLLYQEGYTIAGARKYLARYGKAGMEALEGVRSAEQDGELSESDELSQEPVDDMLAAEDDFGGLTIPPADAGDGLDAALETALDARFAMEQSRAVDPGWLDAIREELRALKAKLQEARSLKA